MKRSISAALTLVLLVPALALGASSHTVKSHTINATIHAATVQTVNNVGIVAGTVSDKTLGQGAIVYKVFGTAPNLKTTFIGFTAHGTISGKGTVTVTVGPNNTATYSGTANVTKGTGTFKGATGKITISGSSDANGELTLHGSGKIKY